MVEWTSPAKITKDGQVFDCLMHTLLSLYMYVGLRNLSLVGCACSLASAQVGVGHFSRL
jgi:hypothetical protein